ncbi:hypothetical protein MMH89_03850 [Candidatus Comchoanobacter bicostacola]|uniref:Uncharacterized protein n=1 Tax=Candidatus Comchoanobacter bicostacola TaxID=2919598 RepID=A0ABY5DJ42_9GAMM|nr:hypothetical protein [Candidatus Comchoanobacter bicostacola]UTC24351.1 hypothetical protein MMH89_03850 [Candidatus Comchoanobacter bicostacola]
MSETVWGAFSGAVGYFVANATKVAANCSPDTVLFGSMIDYLKYKWIARKDSSQESGKFSYTTFWWLMYAWYAIKSIFGYKDLQRVKLCTKLLKKMNSGSLSDGDRDDIINVMPNAKESAANFTALVNDSLQASA